MGNPGNQGKESDSPLKKYKSEMETLEGYITRPDGLVVPKALYDQDPVFAITGKVDEKMVTKLHENLVEIESQGTILRSVRVSLTSFGGSVDMGFGVHDLLRTFGNRNRVPIEITGYGPVMSMGAYVIQAGDIRIMSESSRLLLHPINSRMSGDKEYIAAKLQQTELMSEMYASTVANRAQRAGRDDVTPKIIAEYMYANSKVGTFFTAQEALEAGLIDEVE